jgi:hypothetical protein
MGWRGATGVLFLLVGGIWIAQGTDVLQGSPMTGHGEWAAAGTVAVVVGVALVAWDVVVHRRRP